VAKRFLKPRELLDLCVLILPVTEGQNELLHAPHSPWLSRAIQSGSAIRC
jgi:hypothetical protein